MENGTYLFWSTSKDGLPRMHSAMIQADSPAEAVDTFVSDVLYQEKLEDGHRVIALGPFEPDRMEYTIGGTREIQDILQSTLSDTTIFEFVLAQRWEPLTKESD